MSELAAGLERYLALRRSLGYKLERSGQVLADFVAHLDEEGVSHISTEMALSWAINTTNPDSSWRAQRLGFVRGLARYLHSVDPGHEVPPAGLLARRRGRLLPYLFSPTDIEALMDAAARLASPFRAQTMKTLIGLLAVTGLRRRGDTPQPDRHRLRDRDHHGARLQGPQVPTGSDLIQRQQRPAQLPHRLGLLLPRCDSSVNHDHRNPVAFQQPGNHLRRGGLTGRD